MGWGGVSHKTNAIDSPAYHPTPALGTSCRKCAHTQIKVPLEVKFFGLLHYVPDTIRAVSNDLLNECRKNGTIGLGF